MVVLAGSLLGAAEKLLAKGSFAFSCHRLSTKHLSGIHPSLIATSFLNAATKAVEYLTEMSTPVDLRDSASLLRAATTSLNSKIVSQYSSTLAPIAVKAVTRISNSQSSTVDLRDIRIVKKVGGTIEDTTLVEGVVLNQNMITSHGSPTRIEKAKIGLIQFQLSPPKPDVCSLRISQLSLTNPCFADGPHCNSKRLPSDG